MLPATPSRKVGATARTENAPPSYRPHREAVDEEGRGVVEETLSFEDGHDPVRRPNLAENSGCRGRVRWRHDGAQGDGGRPRQARHERVGDEGNRGRGQENGPDGQAGHGHPVVPEIPGRRVIRCVEQHGGDEEGQSQLGIEDERGGAGHERQRDPTHGKQRRIGRLNPPGGGGQQDGGHQQDQDRLESDHQRPRITMSEGLYSWSIRKLFGCLRQSVLASGRPGTRSWRGSVVRFARGFRRVLMGSPTLSLTIDEGDRKLAIED